MLHKRQVSVNCSKPCVLAWSCISLTTHDNSSYRRTPLHMDWVQYYRKNTQMWKWTNGKAKAAPDHILLCHLYPNRMELWYLQAGASCHHESPQPLAIASRMDYSPFYHPNWSHEPTILEGPTKSDTTNGPMARWSPGIQLHSPVHPGESQHPLGLPIATPNCRSRWDRQPRSSYAPGWSYHDDQTGQSSPNSGGSKRTDESISRSSPSWASWARQNSLTAAAMVPLAWHERLGF